MKTNLQHKQHKTFFGRNAILLAITALALCASPSSRGDETCRYDLFTRWTLNGTGDWFVNGNWDHGYPSVCHIPAAIDNGGTAQIISTDPAATACETFLAESASQSGNLAVDGGSLSTCNELHVGYAGTGALKITNGGNVSTTFGADIGAVSGAYGSATVDGIHNGTASVWTIGLNGTGYMSVGGTNQSAGGTGLLTVTNSGTVNAGSVYVYASGTLTGNSTVKAANGTTVQGTVAPNWTLTIASDLTFATTASITPIMQCTVTPQNSGNDLEVQGAATLTGAHLSVTMTGTFTPSTTFILLHADNGLNGTFGSQSINYAPPSQCFTPIIQYDAHNVKLYLQPCTS